jgi:class 3 adenylate cyclase
MKVIRMFFPMVEEAFSNNLISQKDYNEIKEHLDLSRDDLTYFKNLIVDELFPNESWKHMLTPFKVHTSHPEIGILFCDIVGYSTYVKEHSLQESIKYIDAFYTKIDMIVYKCQVQKVETIGDAYLIVSENICDLLMCSKHILNEFQESVRIGIHCGEAASCTLGISKLRHAYIGHSVNIAARLESNGVPGKVHISSTVKNILDANMPLNSSYNTKSTQFLDMKGIGKHKTFVIDFQKME